MCPFALCKYNKKALIPSDNITSATHIFTALHYGELLAALECDEFMLDYPGHTYMAVHTESIGLARHNAPAFSGSYIILTPSCEQLMSSSRADAELLSPLTGGWAHNQLINPGPLFGEAQEEVVNEPGAKIYHCSSVGPTLTGTSTPIQHPPFPSCWSHLLLLTSSQH